MIQFFLSLFRYLFMITTVNLYHLILPLALLFTILLTTISLFGKWPYHLAPPTPTTPAPAASQTSTYVSDPNNDPQSTSNDIGPPTPTATAAAPSGSSPSNWTTPSRVRGTAFALSLVHLWYLGEWRALNQLMLTANLMVMAGYGGLWVWYRYERQVVQ